MKYCAISALVVYSVLNRTVFLKAGYSGAYEHSQLQNLWIPRENLKWLLEGLNFAEVSVFGCLLLTVYDGL